MSMCHCTIIPKDVLDKLSKDTSLSQASRQNFKSTIKIDGAFRTMRAQALTLSGARTGTMAALPMTATAPSILVYDCKHSQNLPGAPVPGAATSADPSVHNAQGMAQKVAEFYKAAFGRNSVDNGGMTILSSVHFGHLYNNAFWNGGQMVYGDGDGDIFVDFTKGNDVICHELTHGVTQHTLRLNYTNQAGGLNEGLSDIFGSMFRQWLAGQDYAAADWLIGHDIMGPGAVAKGYSCLRDMADPAAKHCLAPQPTNMSQYHSGMDPHYSSGIPNLAFHEAAKRVGGKSWETVGKVWYGAMMAGASPNMKMASFAKRTRKVAKASYGLGSTVAAAVDAAWHLVGV